MPPIKHSKSSGNILHQLGVTPIGNTLPQPVLAPSNYRHPMLPQQPPPIPLLTSASSGNLLHVSLYHIITLIISYIVDTRNFRIHLGYTLNYRNRHIQYRKKLKRKRFRL